MFLAIAILHLVMAVVLYVYKKITGKKTEIDAMDMTEIVFVPLFGTLFLSAFPAVLILLVLETFTDVSQHQFWGIWAFCAAGVLMWGLYLNRND